eukprot:c14642_g1_i1 orf=2-262(-)
MVSRESTLTAAASSHVPHPRPGLACLTPSHCSRTGVKFALASAKRQTLQNRHTHAQLRSRNPWMTVERDLPKPWSLQEHAKEIMMCS